MGGEDAGEEVEVFMLMFDVVVKLCSDDAGVIG